MNHAALIQQYQSKLDAVAVEKTRLWWERYMKGVIPFRGVGIPQNREILLAWRKEHGLEQWSHEAQLELALAFFREPTAEDKLAGILFLQNFLYDKLPWEHLLARYEQLYAEELIFDWNVCDWFCVRVLGAMLKTGGKPYAQALASWQTAANLWQARSAVVPFVNVASEANYYPYMQSACSTLIKREERFAKTAVGWLLHDVSKYDEPFVVAFVESHLAYFSKESLSNALKYFDGPRRNKYLTWLKTGSM